VPLEERAKGETTWYLSRKPVRQQVVAAIADVSAAEHGKEAGRNVALKLAE
jgi:hypothetical protein